MLELRPNCETCDCDLPNGKVDAYICTFECTFCESCAKGVHSDVCPNCGGNFTLRPVRPAKLLQKYPQSTKRIVAKT